MNSDSLQSLVRWTLIPLAAAVIYAGGTIYRRSSENRKLEQAAVRSEAEADRKVVDQLGGGALKLLVFYANPPVLARGAKTLLCYGVASAKTVTIEPHVADVKPALSQCVEAHPQATTKYTLTAGDGQGRKDSRTIEVIVR